MLKRPGNFLLLLLPITIINSQYQSINITIDELKFLNETLHNSTVYMQKVPQNENIAICIGTTKSGKSTLINYLMKNPLIVEKIPGQPYMIKKADNSPGPAIGKGSVSKTKIPSRWTSELFPTMSLWDSPGFRDNRGNQQDITNAYYMYQLLQKVDSLKIILVVDIIAIQEDHVSSFIDVLTDLEHLMPDNMTDWFACTSVIFSKAPKDYYELEVNKTYIKNLLNENIIKSEVKKTKIAKDFVQFLIENETNMGIFRRPEKGGIISGSDIDVGIVPAILNTISIKKSVLKKMNPSISATSKSYLFTARDKLYSNNTLEVLQDIVSSILESKVLNYNSMNIKQKSQSEINKFGEDFSSFDNNLNNAIDNSESLFEKIQYLQEIPYMKEKLEEHSLIEKIGLGSFINKILKSKENSVFDSSLNTVLRSSVLKLQHVTCSQISGGWKMNVTGGIINFKNIRINQCDGDIKFLEIFATQRVIIDHDLMLIGRKMQVTIIAPVWEIEGTRTIALNGLDGQNQTELRAAKVNTFESNGIDGLPGFAGESAGNFYGVASKIISGKQLIILANGGRGGNGQHGGNGGFYGGKGGASGQGGKKGSVVLYELSKNDAVSSVRKQTLEGAHGVPGYGGFANIRYQDNCNGFEKCSRGSCTLDVRDCEFLPNFMETSQFEGPLGKIPKGYKSPVPVVVMLKHSINEYKQYGTSNFKTAFSYSNNFKSFCNLINIKSEIF